MAEIAIRAARAEDADTLLAEMRACDRRECEAMAGEMAEFVLRYTLGASLAAWTAEQDGQLVAVFGVTPVSLVNGIGAPWMLGTDRLDRLPRAVMEGTRAYIPRMLALFPRLTNHVDARNTRSLRLLRWLGFEVFPAEPFGVQGLPFHRFEMRA